MSVPVGERLLTDRDVAARYGVNQKTIWSWVRDPLRGFPQPVRFGAKCTRWRESEIDAHIASLQRGDKRPHPSARRYVRPEAVAA